MDKIKGLDKLITDALNNGFFPSANYCLVVKDKSYFNSFGNKTLIPEKEDNNLDTLYDMASCTKVIATTTSIFLLLERGLLRLHDSVSMYLKEFKYPNVTIWDLMTHTSGLPAGVGGSNDATIPELKERIFNLSMQYEKNTKIVYSDVGFMLLGFIIEEISGMPLDEFTKVNVFDKLEMYRSGYSRISNPRFDYSDCAATEIRNDSLVQGLVRGKVHDERAYMLDGVAGHAGLFSNVKDIEHFIRMILDDGMYNGKRFLSKASIDLMFTPQVRETNGVSLNVTQRGLGWIVSGDYPGCGDLASKETIHHTGFTGTNIFIDRINKIGFSLLTNRVHPTRSNTLIIPFRGKLGNYIIANFGGE